MTISISIDVNSATDAADGEAIFRLLHARLHLREGQGDEAAATERPNGLMSGDEIVNLATAMAQMDAEQEDLGSDDAPAMHPLSQKIAPVSEALPAAHGSGDHYTQSEAKAAQTALLAEASTRKRTRRSREQIAADLAATREAKFAANNGDGQPVSKGDAEAEPSAPAEEKDDSGAEIFSAESGTGEDFFREIANPSEPAAAAKAPEPEAEPQSKSKPAEEPSDDYYLQMLAQLEPPKPAPAAEKPRVTFNPYITKDIDWLRAEVKRRVEQHGVAMLKKLLRTNNTSAVGSIPAEALAVCLHDHDRELAQADALVDA